MTKIYWKAEEFKYKKHSADWYWVFWVLTLSFAFLFFYFLDDYIFSVLILFSAMMINISHFKKPQIKKYSLDNKNIYLANGESSIPFENIEFYNIDLNNMKILIKRKSKFYPLIQIPFEPSQNIFKIDKFLSTKIKKDLELKIPVSELLINKIIGF